MQNGLLYLQKSRLHVGADLCVCPNSLHVLQFGILPESIPTKGYSGFQQRSCADVEQ